MSAPVADHASPLLWPPSPHDPRERELALQCDDWEVRIFTGRMFQYFVTRGFWHLQLWHRRARVSVLTPSRLTQGFYEALPMARWKAHASTYENLTTLLVDVMDVSLPPLARFRPIERSLVDDLVRAANDPKRLRQ